MAASTTIISSMATKQILAELVEAFTNKTGKAVRLESVGGIEAARRVRSGESLDAALLASATMEALSTDGFIDQATIRVFARSRTAIAVQAGARRPLACDESSLKALIAGAQSIGLSTGPSGVSIVKMLQTWGVYEATRSRIKEAPAGLPVAQLLKNGDVEIGFQQLGEFQGHAGIDIVCTLPDCMQPMTDFAIGIMTMASNPVGAQELVRYLLSDDANDAKRRNGMDPA
jgi:molybdate transport system substrate-binding protein